MLHVTKLRRRRYLSQPVCGAREEPACGACARRKVVLRCRTRRFRANARCAPVFASLEQELAQVGSARRVSEPTVHVHDLTQPHHARGRADVAHAHTRCGRSTVKQRHSSACRCAPRRSLLRFLPGPICPARFDYARDRSQTPHRRCARSTTPSSSPREPRPWRRVPPSAPQPPLSVS
jgi:hypothetical protein